MTLESLILKWVGSMAGAVLALLFAPPRNMGAFRRRAAYSLISGMVFANIVRDRAGLPDDAEGTIAGACIAAALGWVITEAAVRVIRAYKRG